MCNGWRCILPLLLVLPLPCTHPPAVAAAAAAAAACAAAAAAACAAQVDKSSNFRIGQRVRIFVNDHSTFGEGGRGRAVAGQAGVLLRC